MTRSVAARAAFLNAYGYEDLHFTLPHWAEIPLNEL